MQAIITEINRLQLAKTHFYSVKIGMRRTSEIRDFFDRMKLIDKNKRESEELFFFLKKIGEKTGALDRYFRNEGYAERILQEYTIDHEKDYDENDFGLRLYCYRINEEIVILFNGDRKTKRNPELCENCCHYFREAQNIAKAIDLALSRGDLEIEKRFYLKPTRFTFELL